MQYQYADVIIDISHEKVDRPFSYRIPERLRDELAPGMSVIVPFGKGNTPKNGYVIGGRNQTELAEDKIKDILDIQRDRVSVQDDYIRLAAWMKEQYGSTMIASLKTVLPMKEKMKALEVRYICLRADENELMTILSQCVRKHQYAKARLLEELRRDHVIPYSFVIGKLGVGTQTISSMVRDEIIRVEVENEYRNPIGIYESEDTDKVLSDEQQEVIRDILERFDHGDLTPGLLHGITGSGKTEVYIQLAREMQKRGKQTIVLIPEIALTYQTVMRFYRHFGDRVSVINSTLSKGEKFDQCERAANGELDVVIGPRSALFTPFEKLGLIIMDEEHEGTYKSESVPKYHARNAAIELARMKQATVLLGSATPSIESYYLANNGTYKLYKMTKRLTGGALPSVHTVDLREELKKGNRTIFSRKLQELLEDRLKKGQQSMLFINRRGYAGFVSCRSCGHVMKCPHCDVSLAEHNNGTVVCHYCGYTTARPALCPECGSKYILGFKAGTQQIEEKLHQMYPQARILRMDADTTRKKDSYEKILTAFKEGEADILVGTQMIVKGHDFPNVTLVGVLAADLSLHAGDYRAGERTFELLTQAAGRAGRGEQAGEVVIQTYDPEHYSIVHAANQDYESFYQEEILYREFLQYPPVANMVAVLVSSPDDRLAQNTAKVLQEQALKAGGNALNVVKATIGKLQDVYRYIFYIKHNDYNTLIHIKDELESTMDQESSGRVTMTIDFNPMSSY